MKKERKSAISELQELALSNKISYVRVAKPKEKMLEEQASPELEAAIEHTQEVKNAFGRKYTAVKEWVTSLKLPPL